MKLYYIRFVNGQSTPFDINELKQYDYSNDPNHTVFDFERMKEQGLTGGSESFRDGVNVLSFIRWTDNYQEKDNLVNYEIKKWQNFIEFWEAMQVDNSSFIKSLDKIKHTAVVYTLEVPKHLQNSPLLNLTKVD